MNRRTFIRRTGATAAALATLGAVRPVAATQPGQPDYVTIDYPAARLERYRPRLVTRQLDVDPDGWWAWRASSAEYDGEWLCYWCYYPVQVGATSSDSHVPDREPVYIRLDDTDSVDRLVFDRYHYLVGESVPQDREHQRLRSINPWHNYRETEEEGVLLGVNDLRDRYQPWLDAGWSVSRRAVTDPPHVLSRGHWWPANDLGFSLTARFSRVFDSLPIALPGRDT